MDIDTIVGLDAIDGLDFRTSLGIGQLIVGTAIDNRSLDTRTLKGSACDRNHRATAVLGVFDGKSLSERYFQLEGELEFWAGRGLIGLCIDLQRQNCKKRRDK